MKMKTPIAGLVLLIAGVAMAMGADSALSQDLGARMDRIVAEKKARAEASAQDTGQPAGEARQSRAQTGERQNVVGLFAQAGNCPAWTENTYVACDCEANALPDRNAKIAWRSACGVMAQEQYSGAFFQAVAQIDCARKSEFDEQVRRQIAGSGAEGSIAYADQAWNRWKSSTGCQGSPIPSAPAPAGSGEPALACNAGDFAVRDLEIPFKRGELTCADGTRQPYEIELKQGFVFRIRTSDGRLAIFNASRNKDPQTGAYLLDPEFVAGTVCGVQASPEMTKGLSSWLEGYFKDAMTSNLDGLRGYKRGSSCIGVRG